MLPKMSVSQRLESQIVAKTKYLHECEDFLEHATKELEKAPWNGYMQRKVQILGRMVFSTKRTLTILQRMLNELQ